MVHRIRIAFREYDCKYDRQTKRSIQLEIFVQLSYFAAVKR